MSFGDNEHDPDDMFKDTRMSFWDHIEELRMHLWRAIIGFVVALCIGLAVGKQMERFIAAPVERQLEAFYERRVEKIGEEASSDARLKQANQPKFVRLAFLEQQIQGMGRGQQSMEEPARLPEDIKPLPYIDLVTRAQLFYAAAYEATQAKEWEPLQAAARGLERTAQFLERANEVPPAYQEGGAEMAATLAKQASQLHDAADRKSFERAKEVLAELGETLGNRGLVRLWVRVEEPVRFAATMAAAQRKVTRPASLATMNVTEAFVVYFKVSIYCGLVLAGPWIFYQLWSFVAAGLYPSEKRLVNVYLPISMLLFLAGVMLCQFWVIPVAVDYLLSFNEWMGLEPDLRLNEWLSFAIMMPLIFGIAFQLPLVMLFLFRLGVVDVSMYRKHRRIAMFLMAVLAVILSASPDVFSMMSLTVPLWILYEFGILLCIWSPRPAVEYDETDGEEMIEV